MGAQGIEENVQGDYVLDAGALIALERGSDALVAFVKQAAELNASLVVPASVLAQAWRGGPRSARLARLIEGCQDDPLDEARAREVGERLGKRSRTDIADAHVVSCALKHNAAVVTSDSNDIEELAAPDEDLVVVAI